MPDNFLTNLKEYDDAREDFPGEHWIVLAAGLGLWYLSSKQSSVVGKLVGMAAATALVGRAASGRNGVVKLLRYTPVGGAMRRAQHEDVISAQPAKFQTDDGAEKSAQLS